LRYAFRFISMKSINAHTRGGTISPIKSANLREAHRRIETG
jgi:hypothetical protein